MHASPCYSYVVLRVPYTTTTMELGSQNHSKYGIPEPNSTRLVYLKPLYGMHVHSLCLCHKYIGSSFK